MTLKDDTIKENIGNRLLNCNTFYTANTEKKIKLFQNFNINHPKLCKLCTSWNHDSSECKVILGVKYILELMPKMHVPWKN